MTNGSNSRGRWVLAGALALALGFAALPAGLRFFETEKAAASASSEPAAAFCDARRKPADLSFTVKDMNGRDVSMAEYKGKIILLNFWATWCGPCKAEIPGFVSLYSAYREKGFVVLGISTDDTPQLLQKFAQQYEMNYPVLVGSGRGDITDDAYGPMWGIPVSFLIGKDGTICKRYPGLVHKDQLERELKGLL